MRLGRTRGASVAGLSAALMIGLVLTGCGRLADPDETGNGPTLAGTSPSSTVEASPPSAADNEASVIDEIAGLLDEAESAVDDVDQDTTEGERNAGLGSEP